MHGLFGINIQFGQLGSIMSDQFSITLSQMKDFPNNWQPTIVIDCN